MFISWLGDTVREFGGPVVLLSSLYSVLGLSFLILSPTVGAVLLGTGLGIAGLFVFLAFLHYRRERRRIERA